MQGLPGFGEGGVMMAAHLRLDSVLVVIAGCSTDLVIICITYVVQCTAMILDELIASFSQKKLLNIILSYGICLVQCAYELKKRGLSAL